MLAGWLVGNNFLLGDFGPYGVTFINVCVVIAFDMVMLLRDFGPYIFSLCWLVSDHLIISDFGPYGQFLWLYVYNLEQ
jgi:hypothetical protein